MSNLVVDDAANSPRSEGITQLPPRLELELTTFSCLERKRAHDRGEWGNGRFGTIIVIMNLFNACAGYRNQDPEDPDAQEEGEEDILNQTAMLWTWGAMHMNNLIPENWTRLSDEKVQNLIMAVCDTIEEKYNIEITFIVNV